MSEERPTDPIVLAGRYRLEEEIGTGGMARVYAAHDLRHDRRVAVKVLRTELASGVAVERFLREIGIAARLSHARIVPLFDSGMVDAQPYYVMPLVRGETLRQKLEREGPLPVAGALSIAAEVADALAHAHREGIIHRDIKPANILIEDDHARVTDFGIAAGLAAAGERQLTTAGTAIGTPTYMSPEQALSERDVDGRSDIYSLGCVLYEMLTGDVPHPGTNPQSIIARKAAQPAPSVRLMRETLSPRIDQIVARSLARLPADRFGSAEEFAHELRAALLETGSAASPSPKRSRNRNLAVAAAVTLVLAAAAAVGIQSRRGQSPIPVSDDVIAVFPFASTGTDSAGLGRGIVFLLDKALDGSGRLRSVNPHSLFAALPAGGPGLDPDRARTIAASFGARRFILGSIVDAGARVQMAAEVYSGSNRPDTTAEVEGAKEELLPLAHSLALGLLSTELGKKGSLRSPGAPSSLDAIKLYLDGLEATAAGSYRTSVERYRAALAHDSMLIPAWYQLAADAHAGILSDSVARLALIRAARYADQLSDRDRALLGIQLAKDSGLIQRSYDLIDAFVRRYPNDHEGWQQRGDLLFTSHMMVGRPLSEADAAYRRAMALHGVRSIWDVDRLMMTLIQNDRVAFDSLYARVSAGPLTHDFAWSILAGKPFLYGDRAGQERVMAEAREREVDFVYSAALSVATVDVPAAMRLLELYGSFSTWQRVSALAAIAYLQAGMGRWRAADSTLGRLAAIDSAQSLMQRTWLALLPGRTVSGDSLAKLAAALQGGARATRRSSSSGVQSTNPDPILRQMTRGYLLGLIAANRGEYARASSLADEVERLPAPFEAVSLSRDLAWAVRAEILLRQGRVEDALAQFDWGALGVRFPANFNSVFMSRARERYLFASLLDSMNHADADRWLAATAINQLLHDYVFKPQMLIRHGRLLERRGRRDLAHAAYERAAKLLRDPDPEFRALRESAVSAAARLKRN